MTVYVNGVAQGAGGLASGEVTIWSGTIADIPSGRVICDGNNSTPNLLGKFVEGVATAATNPGATGGAVSKTTVGHAHFGYQGGGGAGIGAGSNGTNTVQDSITDIRPPFYDVAFIMKT